MKLKIIIFISLLIGGISFLTGMYGFYRLYERSGSMEHTTGVITHLETEKTYRHRKIRYKHTARIRYNTKQYDNIVNMQVYNPFISQGDKISLWYNPDHTEQVVIPSEEGLIWGGTCVFGAFCIFIGVITIKAKKHED